MSTHFLTSLVSRLLGLALVSWVLAFPFAFHISVLFFFTCHWISFVFLLYGRRISTHSVDPSPTHFQVSFQAWDWLWYPKLWSQMRNSGEHGAEISIQISALAWVEPRSDSDLGIQRQRTLPLDCHAPPPFSRLLRHAGGYSGTILTPNLQGENKIIGGGAPMNKSRQRRRPQIVGGDKLSTQQAYNLSMLNKKKCEFQNTQGILMLLAKT